jgi:hypothetical protein
MTKIYNFPIKPLGLWQKFENMIREGMDKNSVPKEKQEEVIESAKAFLELPGDVMKQHMLQLMEYVTKMNDYENAILDERRKLEKELSASKDKNNTKGGYKSWATKKPA